MLPIFKTLENHGCLVEPCGSRVTCSPAPTETDADYLVQIMPSNDGTDKVAAVVNELSGAGFEWEGGEHYQDAAGEFVSWRSQNNINLIVTASRGFAEKHRTATALCKRLNLLNKQDRIALFQAVLYGEIWDGETWCEMKAKREAKHIEAFKASIAETTACF